MTKTEQYEADVKKAQIEGFVTVCPICDAICTDYYCRECMKIVEPKQKSKELYIIDIGLTDLMF